MIGNRGYGIAALLILLILLTGCAADSGRTKPSTGTGTPADSAISRDEDIEALYAALIGLDAEVDGSEARLVAETAVTYSHMLAADYRVVRPAVWHNILVRLGFRERGLCYHWTTDLMRRLQALKMTSLDLHWGVAHRGSQLREHNTVVVTARGRRFESGIVLDPWRYSGDLFWAAVPEDGYPWKELPENMWF